MPNMIQIQNGGFQFPDGTAVTGVLVLKLSQEGKAPTGQVVSAVPVSFPIVSGNVPASPPAKIWSNAELTPSGSFYTTTVLDSNGLLVEGSQQIWVFSQPGGSIVDLGTLIPSPAPVPVYPGAILTNPSGNQTISTGNLTVIQDFTAANINTGGNLDVDGASTVGGNQTVSGSQSVENGLTIKGGTTGGTQASSWKMFNSNAFSDDYLQFIQDTTFGGFFRRGHTNNPTYISTSPNGVIPDGTARALFRVYGTDVVADSTNYESFDTEAERAPASSPGGPLTVYYLKTRIGGAGVHRPLVHQIGGINLLYIDPVVGCIVTCPKSVDTLGASVDFVTTSANRGDIVLGVNGRAIRSVDNAGTNTIPLVSANASNEAVVGAVSTNTRIAGKITGYNGVATVANGVASQVAAVDLTAQTAAVGTTTIYAAPASGAGQYRLSWNAKVTTVATTSSTLGALTIVYTDPDSVVQTITAAAQVAGGTIATSSGGNTTTTVLLGLPLLINAKASTNITYAMGYASNSASQMVFNLHLKLEYLG